MCFWLVVQSLSHKGHKHHSDYDKARDPVLGDILVVVAQIAAALQFIIEEKYLAKYRVPALLGVGLEGMWGLLLSAIALPILSNVHGSDGMAIDSLVNAFKEIANSWQLQVRPPCACSKACHDVRCHMSHCQTPCITYVLLKCTAWPFHTHSGSKIADV